MDTFLSQKIKSPLEKMIEATKKLNQTASEKIKEIKEKSASLMSGEDTEGAEGEERESAERVEAEGREEKEREEREREEREEKEREEKEREEAERDEKEREEAEREEAEIDEAEREEAERVEAEREEAERVEAEREEAERVEAEREEAEELDFDFSLDDDEKDDEKSNILEKTKETIGKVSMFPLSIFVYIKYGLIIAIIMFLGLNILAYVGQDKDYFQKIIDNFIVKHLYKLNDNVRVLMGLPPIVEGDEEEEDDEKVDSVKSPAPPSNLGKAIQREKKHSSTDNSKMSQESSNEIMKKLNSFKADDAMESTIQNNLKSGWCYIGQDRGFRSCIEVSDTDTCISGDIFPSKDICINPSLRE